MKKPKEKLCMTQKFNLMNLSNERRSSKATSPQNLTTKNSSNKIIKGFKAIGDSNEVRMEGNYSTLRTAEFNNSNTCGNEWSTDNKGLEFVINSTCKKYEESKESDVNTPMFLKPKQKDTSGKYTVISNAIEIFSSDKEYEDSGINEEYSIEELLGNGNHNNSKHCSIEELNIDLTVNHDSYSDSENSIKNNEDKEKIISKKQNILTLNPNDFIIPQSNINYEITNKNNDTKRLIEKDQYINKNKCNEKLDLSSNMLIYGSFSPIHIHQNLEKDKDEDKHDEISAINPLDNTIEENKNQK